MTRGRSPEAFRRRMDDSPFLLISENRFWLEGIAGDRIMATPSSRDGAVDLIWLVLLGLVVACGMYGLLSLPVSEWTGVW